MTAPFVIIDVYDSRARELNKTKRIPMSMKKKCAIILLILMALGIAATVAACSPAVEIASVAISENSGEYKTRYIVGEDLDITGIVLAVTRTDGEVYEVYATDVRQDLVILNFSTAVPTDRLSVVLEYRGIATSYDISVVTEEVGTTRYDVTFDSMGGTEVEPQNIVEYGYASEPEPAPTRDGYRFMGWYTERTYNNQFNFQTARITGDITLYARWARLYTIYFYSDDGVTLVTSREVEAGGTLSDIPAVPSRDGYDAAWSRSVFANINTDVTVYAVYTRQTFDVTFCYRDADGRTLNTLRVFEGVEYGTNLWEKEAAAIAAITDAVPDTVGNSVFTGTWSNEASLRNVTSDIIAEAQFAAARYTVTYYWNYPDDYAGENFGAEYGEPAEVTYNTPIRTAPEDPSLEGYRFDGWFTQTGAVTRWDFTNGLVTRDMSLYAGWTKLYTVSRYVPSELFPPEDGTVTTEHNGREYRLYSASSVPSGGSDPLGEVPALTGYTGAWYFVNGDAATQSGLTAITADISLFADYEKIVYNVTFYEYDRVTVAEIQRVAYMDYASPASVTPSRTGYTFAGWDYDFENTPVTASINIYPTYTANAYTVRFFADDTDAAYTDVTVIYGDVVGLITPDRRQGYRFDGWLTARDGVTEWADSTVLTAETLAEHGVIASAEDFDFAPDAVVLRLYAGWVMQFSVIFLDAEGGGIEGSDLSLDAGASLTADMAPDIPVSEGHTGSWYVADEDNRPTDREYEFGSQLTDDLTLIVVYTINTYSVTFTIDFVNSSGVTVGSYPVYDASGSGEPLEIRVAHGATVRDTDTGFALPAKTDERVAGLIVNYGGWTSSGDSDFEWRDPNAINAPITSDTVITATCSLNRFTVTWYADEGGKIPLYSAEADFGSSVSLPQSAGEPVREGYTFSGRWTVYPEGATSASVDRDITFIPIFTINSYSLQFIGEGNIEYPQWDMNGDSLASPVTHTYGTVVAFTSISDYHEFVEVPSEEGVDFLGWRQGAAGTRIYYDPELGTWYLPGADGEDEATGCYLIVTDDGNYLIDADGETLAGYLRTGAWREHAVPVSFDPASGWYAEGILSGGTGDLAVAGAFYELGDNAVFYAVTAASSYTVTFVTNITGYEIPSVTVTHNDTLAAPSAAWENMVFLAWYTDPSLVSRYDFSEPVTDDLTLYAAWESVTAGTDGIQYTLNENGTEAYVTGYTGEETEVTVANYYNNVPVTQIGTEAFADKNVTSVTLPDTIVSFGPGAFENTDIASITIPQRVTTIPDNCFRDSEFLTEIVFREGTEISVIGSYAFAGCVSLRLASLKVQDASGDISSADNVSFPSTLTEIREGAFMGAASVRRLYFPSSLQRLGNMAFADTNALMFAVFERAEPAVLGTEVFVSAAASYLAFRAYVPDVARYSSGSGWSELAASERVLSIYNIAVDASGGRWAYEFDTSTTDRVVLLQYLGGEDEDETDVAVPETVTSENGGAVYTVHGLGTNVFSGIITSVSFNSDISVDPNAFGSAVSLENLTLIRRTGYTVSGEALSYAYTASDSLYSLTLVDPDITAENIFGGALPSKITVVNVYGTTDMTLPEYMFADQTFITEAYIGEHVVSIGANAFSGAAGLSAVYFDSDTDLVSISTGAFSGCTSLGAVYAYDTSGYVSGLPGSVSAIGDGTFDGVPWVDDYVDDDGFTMLGAGILYAYSGTASVVRVPENTIAVSPNAFEYNSYIRQAILPEGLGTIGEYAFANAVNLESVFLMGSGAEIGANAFYNSSKFAVLIISGGASVATNAFGGTLYDSGELTVYSVDTVAGASDVRQVTVVGLDEGSGWVYAFYSNQMSVLKYYGDDVETVVVPRTINSQTVQRIGDYAFTRGTLRADMATSLIPIGSHPFGGLTSLETLTLTVNEGGTEDPAGSIRSGTGADNLIYSLISDTSGGVELVINTPMTVAGVLGQTSGAALPANLRSVTIDVSGATSVPASFLENAASVTEIFVLGEDGGRVALDSEEAETALRGVSIGSAAFRNTGWMLSDASDFVFIGGMLIEVRSAEPVVDFRSAADRTITSINGYAFAGTNAETVYIPDTVTEISADAFNGAERLVRLVLPDRLTAPDLTDGTALNGLSNTLTVLYSGNNEYSAWQSGAQVIQYGNVYDMDVAMSSEGGVVTRAHYLLSGGGVLYMYRVYMTDEEGAYIGEATSADVPETLAVTSTSGATTLTAVGSLGNNVFGFAVSEIGLSYSDSVTQASLGNLGDITELRITGVSAGGTRALDAGVLRSVIDAHNIPRIVYNGAVTLNDLLNGNQGVIAGVTDIEIEYGTEETADELLAGWDHITRVTFPDTIRKVGVNSLENTLWYSNYASNAYGQSHVILGGVLYYRYKATGSSGNIVTIPADAIVVNTAAFAAVEVTGSGEYAYSSLGLSITTINFEAGSRAETILEYAFAYNQYLTTISIPETVTEIASTAFEGTGITATDGALIVNSSSSGKILVRYSGTDSHYTVPFDVRVIAAGAFAGNTYLTSISVASSASGSLLESIGENAFNGCSNLSDLGNLAGLGTIDHIGRGAFDGTAWLNGHTSSDATIGNATAGYILYKKTVRHSGTYELGADIRGIVDGALDGMTGTGGITGIQLSASIMVSPSELRLLLSTDGITSVTLNGDRTLSDLIGGGTLDNITSVIVPYGMTAVTSGFINGWSGVTDVTVPYTVTAIGAGAFDGTAWLDAQVEAAESGTGIVLAANVLLRYVGSDGEVYLLSNIAGIAADAFRGNTTVTVVDMSSSAVTDIPAQAFAGCTSLMSVTLSASVTSIGAQAFEGVHADFTLEFTAADPEVISAITAADGAFDGVSEIRVPAAVIEDYRAVLEEDSDKIVGV